MLRELKGSTVTKRGRVRARRRRLARNLLIVSSIVLVLGAGAGAEDQRFRHDAGKLDWVGGAGGDGTSVGSRARGIIGRVGRNADEERVVFSTAV